MPGTVTCPIDGPWWRQLELELDIDDGTWIVFSLGGGAPEEQRDQKDYRSHF